MSKILVSGSLAYDRIMDFPGMFKDHFVADKLHNINVSFAVDSFSENFGGTAGNIAYNLALLGADPHIVATAGADFDRYASHLRAKKINPTSIKIDLEGSTSSAFIVTDSGDNQIAAFSMASGAKPYLPLPSLEGVRCAIIGAGCAEDMTTLPGFYRSQGVRYFYDPGQQIPGLTAEQLRDGISGAEGVFVNDYELSLIEQKTGWSPSDIAQRASALVITLGEKGSRILTKNGEEVVAAVPVSHVIDPTGAGDAYRAGYIVAFLADSTLVSAARLGSAVAAYAVEKYGTQNHTFTIVELKARYQSAYGETLLLS